MADSDRVKIALVGCGNIARAHWRGISYHAPLIEVTAVVDDDPERAAAMAERTGGAAFSSLGDALGSGDFDAVDLMLPHDLHEQAAVEALAAGKHVVLEKPMAMDLESCDRILAAAESAGTVFMIAEQSQYWPDVIKAGEMIEAGEVIARTDGERAYVVMMTRFLPVGLLGLVVASLLAAFMSTIDTHVNLASSFFVNDIYRRFLASGRGAAHYVLVARLASVAVLAMGGLLAYHSSSISGLFLFFLAFLGGVGPVYVARWLWWRVRASTEITAMLASAAATLILTFAGIPWPDSPLSPAGELAPEGRLCLVVAFSMICAACSMFVTSAPDPRTLVGFYRKVRPLGAWGPVRALAPEVQPDKQMGAALAGAAGGLAATYGVLFGVGCFFLGDGLQVLAGLVVAVVGGAVVVRALADLREAD